MGAGVSGGGLGLNARAARLAEAMAAEAQLLRIASTRLDGGARLLDCGIEVAGGLEAGRRMAEVCMGGAGRVELTALRFGDLALPGVVVRTDHPAVACLASQYAGWAVRPDGYFAMGSGPLRAVARVEEELFARLEYAEPADGPGVLVLEGRTPPDRAVVEHVAAAAGMDPERLWLLIAPTASLAGGVQVSARVVETALHKLTELGLDARSVVSAFGSAPVPPVARSDARAIGRTNDCVLYGGTVHLLVQAEDETLAAMAEAAPSCASRDYGVPFFEIFERYDRDFYRVDPHLFSPAEVYLTALPSGRTFHAGACDADVLRRSLLG